MVTVAETFVSIQGESTYAGLPCFFVRLAGCNLRCTYCDTPRALAPGRAEPVAALVHAAAAARTPLVEVTGGEPLLQEDFPALAAALRDGTDATVLVETNGSRDLSAIPEGVIAVVDIKCPGSGEGGSFDLANLDRLRPCDEVKFVLTDRRDYDWARAFAADHALFGHCRTVLFSPAAGRLEPDRLAGWMLADRPAARLQVQLHKMLGVP